MYWHGAGWALLPILLLWGFGIAVAVVAIVVVARFIGGSSKSSFGAPKSDAEEILKQRYARGEITREQYDEMLERIRR